MNFDDRDWCLIERALMAFKPSDIEYQKNYLGRIGRSNDIQRARDLANLIRVR